MGIAEQPDECLLIADTCWQTWSFEPAQLLRAMPEKDDPRMNRRPNAAMSTPTSLEASAVYVTSPNCSVILSPPLAPTRPAAQRTTTTWTNQDSSRLSAGANREPRTALVSAEAHGLRHRSCCCRHSHLALLRRSAALGTCRAPRPESGRQHVHAARALRRRAGHRPPHHRQRLRCQLAQHRPGRQRRRMGGGTARPELIADDELDLPRWVSAVGARHGCRAWATSSRRARSFWLHRRKPIRR
jgi:hypothetical protein